MELNCKEILKEEKMKLEKNDNVNNPKHYQVLPEYQAIDIIDKLCELNSSFFKDKEFSYYAQCLQYLFRCGNKNKLEDLQKAKWYLDRLINIKTIN